MAVVLLLPDGPITTLKCKNLKLSLCDCGRNMFARSSAISRQGIITLLSCVMEGFVPDTNFFRVGVLSSLAAFLFTKKSITDTPNRRFASIYPY